MSPREGIIYGSWMAGIIIFFTIGGMLGLPRIANFFFGILLGGGLSVLIERLYLAKKEDQKRGKLTPPRDSENPYREVLDRDSIACSNPSCDWQGPNGNHIYCPKCDERLY